MDPSRPHSMSRALAGAITPSDRTDRTVTVEDLSIDLRRSRAWTCASRLPVRGSRTPSWSPAPIPPADRPPSYPPELPYLPGLKVSMMAVPGRAGATATWGMLADVESALAAIPAQSKAAGWAPAEGADEGPITAGVRMIALARPGQGRTIIVASSGADSMIMVMDNAQAA